MSGYEVICHASAESLLAELSNAQLVGPFGCVLMDVDLTGLSGIEAQKELRRQHPEIPVIFISAELNAHKVNQAWRDGATEFLFKPLDPESLIQALDRVKARPSSSMLETQPTASDVHRQLEQSQLILGLTERQLQVLSGLVQGHSNTKIAVKLQISPRTVKMHREGIMRRLGLRHLAELVRYYEHHKQLFPKLDLPLKAEPTES